MDAYYLSACPSVSGATGTYGPSSYVLSTAGNCGIYANMHVTDQSGVYSTVPQHITPYALTHLLGRREPGAPAAVTTHTVAASYLPTCLPSLLICIDPTNWLRAAVSCSAGGCGGCAVCTAAVCSMQDGLYVVREGGRGGSLCTRGC